MLESLLIGLQQDVKLLLLAPIVSAIFRFVFIKVYGPSYSWHKDKKKLLKTFSYGFWWGLDFHAYVLLISFVLISLPGAFFPYYFAIGNLVRTTLLTSYLLVLYIAFMGKLIFYYHFKDTYNELVRLGANADKMNFLDIFFNENYGAWILFGIIPFVVVSILIISGILVTPVFSASLNVSFVWQIIGIIAALLITIAVFYWLRYGGTFSHRNKPEWDFIPSIIKNDMFLAKAVIDDLIALELVYKHSINEVLKHDDATAISNLKALPEFKNFRINQNPLELLKKQAKGPKINKPNHIFILVGESLSQSIVDDIYKEYHLADRFKNFKNLEHTLSIDNFLPAGRISQPSIASLLSGLYDSNLEINEMVAFWEHSICTSLPEQLKKLGYKTKFWYGGNLSWASMGLFAPSMGFDECYGGPDICGKNAPTTWLGVYDHIFLEEVRKRILEESNQPTLHFIYTTSNHSPSTIPIEQYGWNAANIFGVIPDSVRNNSSKVANLGTYWYAEQALFDFVDAMKEAFDDSLIIVTGDHPCNIADSLLTYRKQTLRELLCTYFGLYHKDISKSSTKISKIGCHLQIVSTLIEMIAPKGFEYYSLMPSLFEHQESIITPYHWMTESEIGFYKDGLVENISWRDTKDKGQPQRYRERYDYECVKNAYVELTAWVIRHPEILIPKYN